MNRIAIVIGGLAGGLLRYMFETLIPTPLSLPFGTLAVNLVGCFLLGFIYFIADEREWPSWLRLGLGTGFVGAFTTFSTFSLELSELAGQHILWAGAYAIVSIIGGVSLVMLGEWTGSMVLRKRMVTEEVYP
ncbi:fluoride efflux transporter CrcB [Alicyclobacillus mengziensis]|uniref:Fluoride-specific ion channel FluC n=1 Tax=Alicyclobacillus mengziensis TaxID=2931921 RepID=A0A9X7Z8C6_9BACL|nr:fluoride efflux transporter CrcB [Alicyclobacillus mengziensis]QSO48046.1 fluoride efflux transporter CrcB [Alicyclobacillus mengziensis]